MSARVVIYVDEHGSWSVEADEGVEVYSVDEMTPRDRVYRMDPAPIREGVLVGEIHHANDGSPMAARITHAIREARGLPAFNVINGNGGIGE